MSMLDLEEALRIIEGRPNLACFAGQRDSLLLAAAESALGGAFPPTYREFVSRLGAGSFGGFETYGVVDENFEDSAIPNGVWLTLGERHAGYLPSNLLVIGDAGDGAFHCLVLGNGQETPVILFEPGGPTEKNPLASVAEDFGEFFLVRVREQL
jgi:hypothetical protein